MRETGFGVVAHKVVKNRLCSRGILDAYRDHDYVTPRIDAERKIVEVPRPAGVVLALTPSTNPVSTVYFKVLLALLTRNAVVVSPHPFAKECCSDAARVLGEAAVAAGAPDGVVQVVEEPSIPLIDALMTDERTDVILATGGVAVVRAAYSSGQPGASASAPATSRCLVDATADLARAAEKLVDSKAFDNSVLCTNESVLIVEEAGRRPVPPRDEPARRAPARCRGARPGPRHGLPRRPVRHLAGRQGRRRHRRQGRRPGARRAPGSCSRRSTSPSTRSRWRTRSSARCSA